MANQDRVKLKIKKGDTVQVIAGKEKGKTGKVLEVDRKDMRITVEKVNLVKRHTKPTQGSPQGGIVEREASIHYSNVLIFDAKLGKGVRHSKVKPAETTKAKA